MKNITIPFYVENRYKNVIEAIKLKYSLSIGNVIDIINDTVNFDDSSKLRLTFHTFILLAIESGWIELAKIIKKDYKDDIVESQLIADLLRYELEPDDLVELVDEDSFKSSSSAYALQVLKHIIHGEPNEYFEIFEDNDGLIDSVLAGVNEKDFNSWIIRRKFNDISTERCKIILERYPEFSERLLKILSENTQSENFQKFFPAVKDLFVF